MHPDDLTFILQLLIATGALIMGLTALSALPAITYWAAILLRDTIQVTVWWFIKGWRD